MGGVFWILKMVLKVLKMLVKIGIFDDAITEAVSKALDQYAG